ncbi:FtsK/SpoIIIE domain-containing protein [Micromonospora rifamycinica]|uniref:DNA segregation ATPase FtsK/SpoIIIE, S-DNA-T family n=1 Tax=Micromonospora rifamycinica TaxID=291594 RepID=A0A109IM05_9ACTN|nr:FtsK/SpoIIIE domain-containing protein [Micromonospora rifamycinica]KWV33023.1 cell division protein FtsK [Micromonospora rifamycinica]SCG37740.1 DNA segregation ATPase FtsK/SpoIIIE, S-DNA-T family [Micromonospora rifamycinica]
MATASAPTAGIPVGPGLSMFDPIFIGIDEFGQHVYITLAYRNLLAGGEPGGGKSGLLNTIAAHAALSVDSRLVLLDGKLVELGQWEDCADAFIGPDITAALDVLRRLQTVMNNRYAWLRAHGRRKVTALDGLSVITILVDEIAFYSATIGSKQEQEEFVALLRDLVARGRAAGIPVIAATQRPSFDIIPTSLRDLFGYRAAFRCTTPNSSNIVLGHGWAEQGYTATDIAPTNQGAAYLIAEGGTPRRIKVAYLDDAQIAGIADYATWTRRPTRLSAPTGTRVDWETAA